MTDLSTEEVIAGLKWIKSCAVDGYNMTKGQALDVLFAAITALEGMVWRPIDECPDTGEFVVFVEQGFQYIAARLNGGDFVGYDTDEAAENSGMDTIAPMQCVIPHPTHFIPLSALPKPKDKA